MKSNMKPLDAILSSLCHTAGFEYRECIGNKMIGENEFSVQTAFICQIWKNGGLQMENFACPATPEGITETTKETAREWLLYSLITKAINQ